MIPLDRVDLSVVSGENARRFLSGTEYDAYCSLSQAEKEQDLCDLLTRPIGRFTPVNKLYFRSKWADLICGLYGEGPITLLEVASGNADMIPQTLSRSNTGSTYITANMNKDLSKSLLEKTKNLHLTFQLVDDDAARINRYVMEKSVDIIAFQHGVNDVLQAILCGQNGIDTVYTDWMKALPAMIRILQKETSAGTFDEKVKAPFLGLIDNLLLTLKDDGIIAINHYMFQLDLDWGYPEDLFHNLIPMIRLWFASDTDLKEFTIPGFKPQWWLFLKK